MKKASVIGSGMGGLAAAIRLAVQGFEVHVFERNAYTGGKVARVEQGGYSWDAGPSLFTMPELVEELFELAGKNPADYFRYKQLEEVCRYFWEDGTQLITHQEPKVFAQAAEEALNVPASKVERFLKRSAKNYDTAAQLFLYRSMHRWSTWLNKQALRSYFRLPLRALLQTMNGYNQHFFDNPKAVQLFNRFATYNGSDPYQCPALMNVIPHLEHNLGAYYPEDGLHSVTLALTQLAEDLGVAFHLNTSVKQILTDKTKGEVRGVLTDKEKVESDVVVSNADVYFTYTKLLPQVEPPKRLLNQEKSSSGIIFYWGLRGSFPELGLHNILFSEDYPAEFKHIFQEGKLFADPTVYINISSRHTAGHAPEGCENWFVLMNVPHDQGQDWLALVEEMRGFVLNKIERTLGYDIRARIEVEQVLQPQTIESQTGSHLGALYGNASNSRWAAFFRHANYSSQFKGLYFTGGSVHPGGGIPLSLLSARIACNFIARQEK